MSIRDRDDTNSEHFLQDLNKSNFYINKREDKDMFMKFYSDLHQDKTAKMKVLKNGTKQTTLYLIRYICEK